MIGLIEIPNSQDECLSMLFFTKVEEANDYIALFKEKNPMDQTKFKTVKIQKYMCFDSGADEEDCYYKFDPKLQDSLDDIAEE